MVAEAVLDEPLIDTDDLLDLFEVIDTLSDTDRSLGALDGIPPRELVEEVLTLVRQLWPEIETEARAMVDVHTELEAEG
jgi:hypothetical protein